MGYLRKKKPKQRLLPRKVNKHLSKLRKKIAKSRKN